MNLQHPPVTDAIAGSQTIAQRSWKDALTAAANNPLFIPDQRPENVSNEEWWDSVLHNEKERVARFDETERIVAVDEIMLGSSSSEDDMPIVSTLEKRKFKDKVKKRTKALWTYETVVEPTGVVSKYWDADAPSERATKRQAKEKLTALQVASNITAGATKFRSHNVMP
jgi:hypothetical protein